MPTTIAFDLDYTLIRYGVMRIQHPSHKPDPNNPHEELILHLMPGTIEALKQIYSKNHKFILTTARDPDEFFIVRRIIWEIERLSGVHFDKVNKAAKKIKKNMWKSPVNDRNVNAKICESTIDKTIINLIFQYISDYF